MYAAGRIPGSFFRREGRPSEDAILTCRLIDRPLRPSFVKGLRNEIQVVVTVMALNPKDLYDVLAINAASMSTQLAGLPFSGPIGGVRVALIEGQWVAFPTHDQLETAVFDMVVAGRVVGDDVAIMMVEAEATLKTIDLITRRRHRADRGGRGRRASRPPSRSSRPCATRQRVGGRRRSQADRRVPPLPRLRRRRARRRRPPLPATTSRPRSPSRASRSARPSSTGVKAARRPSRSPRSSRGARRSSARPSAPPTKKLRPRARAARQGPHRRPRADRHPHPVGRGRGAPAGARLGAVRARRDADPGRHHAQHAPHGAAARHAQPRDAQALHAQLQLPAVLHR